MPELPEVENVVRTLRPGLLGSRIVAVQMPALRNGQAAALSRIVPQGIRGLEEAICGKRIENVLRHGKHIQMVLSGEEGRTALWVHLGMTGRLTWQTSAEPRDKHTHLIFALGEPGRWLHYTDPRQFGRIRYEPHADIVLRRLGPEPFDVSIGQFYQALHKRRAPVKSVLLDQRFLRGLGNIYADEALFEARIHPCTPASRLTRLRAQVLLRAIRRILSAAIERGGSSVSDYVDAEGRNGSFQEAHQVYRRTGSPCSRCAAVHRTALIRRIVVAGRGTHYCPVCQRQGRHRTSVSASHGRRSAAAERARP